MTKCLQCLKPIHEALSLLNFYRPSPRLCDTCLSLWKQSELVMDEYRCSRCLNYHTTTEGTCLDCQFLAQTFTLMTQLYCDYQYNGIMKDTIHNYKFMRDYYLADLLATMLRLPETTYDLIIPIPSPYERDKERTFNPVSTVLDKMGVKYHNVLGASLRPKQSSLGKLARAKATNPFFIKEDIELAGKEILLVDDIYTTDLTVHHAGEKLYEKSIRKFKVFTFSR